MKLVIRRAEDTKRPSLNKYQKNKIMLNTKINKKKPEQKKKGH